MTLAKSRELARVRRDQGRQVKHIAYLATVPRFPRTAGLDEPDRDGERLVGRGAIILL